MDSLVATLWHIVLGLLITGTLVAVIIFSVALVIATIALALIGGVMVIIMLPTLLLLDKLGYITTEKT